MSLEGKRVSRIKVLNIMEENDAAVEKMANRAIDEVNAQNIKILDIKITGDNLILILGDKESEK